MSRLATVTVTDRNGVIGEKKIDLNDPPIKVEREYKSDNACVITFTMYAMVNNGGTSS